jgi:hypothetical protein
MEIETVKVYLKIISLEKNTDFFIKKDFIVNDLYSKEKILSGNVTFVKDNFNNYHFDFILPPNKDFKCEVSSDAIINAYIDLVVEFKGVEVDFRKEINIKYN